MSFTTICPTCDAEMDVDTRAHPQSPAGMEAADRVMDLHERVHW